MLVMDSKSIKLGNPAKTRVGCISGGRCAKLQEASVFKVWLYLHGSLCRRPQVFVADGKASCHCHWRQMKLYVLFNTDLGLWLKTSHAKLHGATGRASEDTENGTCAGL